jgi:hypothetical protein
MIIKNLKKYFTFEVQVSETFPASVLIYAWKFLAVSMESLPVVDGGIIQLDHAMGMRVFWAG